MTLPAPQAYLSNAERLASDERPWAVVAVPREIRKVAVIGAGTMGIGITMALVNAGLAVTLVDQAPAQLDRAVTIMRKNWARAIDRGQMTAETVDAAIEGIWWSSNMAAIAEADAVIEAVWEDMELKKAVFSQIDRFAKPGALLGSNTSTLDIDVLAASTGRAADVVGLHFFSPAHVMKLLEIVRGASTSPAAIRDSLALAKRMGKVPVVVGVCDGFVGNRLFAAREQQALQMLIEGAMPEQIDRALREFGFPMGTFELMDMTNAIELSCRMRQTSGVKEPIVDRLMELGRAGQKSGKGFYRYDPNGRTPLPDPEVDEIIFDASRIAGIQRAAISDGQIIERMIYPMINEGAKILGEGIAARPGDIDVIWSRGYGWPASKGGPMYHGDVLGSRHILERMLALEAAHGAHFAPASLLRTLAAEDGGFLDEASA